MRIRGTAWLARVQYLSAHLGTRWPPFLEKVKGRYPFLQAPVLPISRIPADEFLALHDEMLPELFDNDPTWYWKFGASSAEYALANQLRGLFAPNEPKRFLLFTPSVYKNYFDGGVLTVEDTGTAMITVLSQVPRHVYFEYSVMGFAEGGLAALQTPVKAQRIRGFSSGDDDVCYRFELGR